MFRIGQILSGRPLKLVRYNQNAKSCRSAIRLFYRPNCTSFRSATKLSAHRLGPMGLQNLPTGSLDIGRVVRYNCVLCLVYS